MGKLTKKKSVVEVGNRCPNHYEIQKENRQKAIEGAKLFDTLPHLQKPIKYLLKR